MNISAPDGENLPEGDRIEGFFERLVVRAATIDERLSDDFEAQAGEKSDTDLAAQRLAAWLDAGQGYRLWRISHRAPICTPLRKP